MELRVFSDKGDRDFLCGGFEVIHHLCPVRKIRRRTVEMQAFAGNFGEMLLLHRKRRFIEILYIKILQHVGVRHITKQRNLVL